jgi:hypothetical protein
MRNYRRLSGDGSVKVVLSGDSNSLPKTTGRREPPSYNSSTTQELGTPPAVPFAFLRLPSRFQENVDFPNEYLRTFQKKPVFAPPPFAQRTSTVGNIIVAGLGSRIRAFRDSHPDPEKVDFPPVPISAFILQPSPLEQNVDSAPPPFPRLQNPCKKARESAIIHVSTSPNFALIPPASDLGSSFVLGPNCFDGAHSALPIAVSPKILILHFPPHRAKTRKKCP